MISHLLENFDKFLLALLNRIFREGTVPSIWRVIIIIPIAKDTSVLGNIPISFTCICKLMEKMVNFRVTWLLENDNMLTPYHIYIQRFLADGKFTVYVGNSLCNLGDHGSHKGLSQV